ncbi:uncharacterized protein LOC131317332 [Rhododendron vialii]|uniref:uncharacterized protein LOC131317332 n=1 Tax=Rhododendron vialii TaxID=182163 RepID=UPI00265DCF88|nr:uncharacterized protein LOC131317332 [Rhododendron vialii]
MDAPIDEEVRQPRFNRLYIFLGAVKTAFCNGCRKIIGMDGCHLKGEYNGQILTAIGVDPNNAMYPMAWVVVEKEDKETWGWFLTLIKMDCNINDSNEHEWTFINDRQKNTFKDYSLEDKFRDCAKASHVPQFQEAMQRVKDEDEKAYEWLVNIPPRYWSRSHFRKTIKCDMVCNNLCEAFNRAILKARDKPIIEMLEWIRCYLSNRMLIRREWIKKFTNPLLPNIYDKIEALSNESSTCYATWFGDLQFQVKVGGRDGKQYTVHLNHRSCTCRRWNLTGLPCPYAMAAIQERNLDTQAFIHGFYSKGSYLKAYEPLINPINGYKM